MKLAEKITTLRKSCGMSQEELAEKLNVSRQAISRWEVGSAMPDATNILRLSKMFGVTTDYLLNDDYESDNDLPKVKEVKEDGFKQIMFYMIVLEIMLLLIQFMTTFILRSPFFAILSLIPFVAMIGGFEYAYRKKAKEAANERVALFRKKLYKISAWLGLYFPIRFLITVVAVQFYSRPVSTLVLECVVLSVYIGVAFLVTLEIEKRYLTCSAKKVRGGFS